MIKALVNFNFLKQSFKSRIHPTILVKVVLRVILKLLLIFILVFLLFVKSHEQNMLLNEEITEVPKLLLKHAFIVGSVTTILRLLVKRNSFQSSLNCARKQYGDLIKKLTDQEKSNQDQLEVISNRQTKDILKLKLAFDDKALKKEADEVNARISKLESLLHIIDIFQDVSLILICVCAAIIVIILIQHIFFNPTNAQYMAINAQYMFSPSWVKLKLQSLAVIDMLYVLKESIIQKVPLKPSLGSKLVQVYARSKAERLLNQ